MIVGLVPLGAQVKGKVTDKSTREVLVGATVYLYNSKIGDFVGLNGNYSLDRIPPGTYTIASQFIGYLKEEKIIQISDTKQDYILLVLLITPDQINQYS